MSDILVETAQRTYKTLVTDIGKSKMALAALNGAKVNIIEAAVGDGGGSYYSPTAAQTALINEVWRGEIANKVINAESANMIDVKVTLPSDVGGWTVREIGLFDDDGDLIVVTNTPDTEKALITTGATASLDLVMHIVFTDVDTITFTVNANLDQVTAADVAKMIQEYDAGSSHASTTILDIILPAADWQQEVDESDYPCRIDVPVEAATDDCCPIVTLSKESLSTAEEAGLCPTAEALDGILRFWAKTVPEMDMEASAALLSGTGSSAGGTGSYVLPAATSETLGGVKIPENSGLVIDRDGSLRLDFATEDDLADTDTNE